LNPFANFIARNIADTTLPSTAPLREGFGRVMRACAEPLKEIEGSEAAALSEAFDSCLANGQTSFTSEALFNRLVIDLWHRRELGCLSLDRQEFASRLEQRGWHYNPETHLWTKREATQSVSQELALFGV
jgi:hypothetical protein